MLIRQLATAMLLVLLVVGTVQAEVERFEIKSREPFAGGRFLAKQELTSEFKGRFISR